MGWFDQDAAKKAAAQAREAADREAAQQRRKDGALAAYQTWVESVARPIVAEFLERVRQSRSPVVIGKVGGYFVDKKVRGYYMGETDGDWPAKYYIADSGEIWRGAEDLSHCETALHECLDMVFGVRTELFSYDFDPDFATAALVEHLATALETGKDPYPRKRLVRRR